MSTAEQTKHEGIVKAFYKDLFCGSIDGNLDGRVASVVSSDWTCTPEPYGGQGAKGLAETLKFFKAFAPDLKYAPQEILQDGNKVVVRSIVTGTPTMPFLGVNPKGSFKINAIDIHEVVAGRIAKTYRVEDWARAVNQIKG